MKGIKKRLSCILAAVMTASAVYPVSAGAELPTFPSEASESSVEKAAEILINSRRNSYDPYGISPIGLESYPASFDLRSADLDGSGKEKNYVTPVKSQYPFASCWGFSAIASAETSILSELGLSYEEYKEKYGEDLDLSEHHLSWFAFTPLPEDDSMGQGGEGLYIAEPDEENPSKRMDVGASPLTATSVFSSGIGPYYEENCPYRGKNGNIEYINTETGEYSPTPKEDGTYIPFSYSADDDWSVDEAQRYLQAYTLEESFTLPSPAQFVPEDDGMYRYVYNQSYTDGIKEQLMKGRAVQVCYNSDLDFLNYDTWAYYAPLNINEDSENGVEANHGVTIVGWDDNYPKENFLAENGLPPKDGAWIVKNSWGSPDGTFPNHSTWGDKGYFYLSYYDHTIAYCEALDFDTTEDDNDSYYYSYKYDYLPATYGNTYDITDEPTYMANIFVTDRNIMLSTLTLQTETPNTQTSFEVYKLNELSENPTDGELIASAKKEYPYGGYHRVDLENAVFIPANTVFSVVVTNKTADGKYEIVNDVIQSELCMRDYNSRSNVPYIYYYGKSVVNPGESYVGNTIDGSVSWNDWKDVIDKSKDISNSFFNKTGYTEQLEKTEKSKYEFLSAVNEYANANPDLSDEDLEADVLPEELKALYDQWDADVNELNRIAEIISNQEFEGLGLTDAEIADMGDSAMYEHDNFPISVIAEPVEAADYTLYYDGETGSFYKEYDHETGEFSTPLEEEIPGAVCDGYKLTLTSDFRFSTSAEDGLCIGKNVELYVPEGENPTIHCGANGTEGMTYCSALIADDGSILNIDGTLEAYSPDVTNTSACGVYGYGDLAIKGKGTLIARGGYAAYDESIEGAVSTDVLSLGVYTDGDLDVSIANLIANGENSDGISYGIEAGCFGNGIFTISDSSKVTAKAGLSKISVSVGCLSPSIDISGSSELTASGGTCGIELYNDVSDNRKICLSEGSVIDAAGEEEVSVGLLIHGGGAALAEMDEDCTFTVRGVSYAAAPSELIGVVATSEGTAVKFNEGERTYVNDSGEIVKEISFRPDNGSSEETSATTEEPTDTEETTDKTEQPISAHTSHSGGGGSKNVSTAKSATPEATETPSDTNKSEAANASSTDDIPFTDIKPSDWFYNAVKAAYTEGLIAGVSDTEFAPNAKLTRGMLVTIIGRMSVGEAKAAAPFTDVDVNAYYAPYVAWAAENGIVLGFGDNTFKPDEYVTREQVAAIFYRYMKNYIGADVSAGENTNILSYTDANEISEYAVSAIQWACAAGIINGYPDGSLAPKNTITRAELTSMISAVSLL